MKEGIKKKLSNVLKDDGLLVIPTAPGEAPLIGLSEEELEQYRTRTMQVAIKIDPKTNVKYGGANPRGDGAAIGY